jgi:hypothetical protein
MTGSHPGGPGDSPPDIVASGNWRGGRRRPADPAAARRQVAAVAAVAVVLFAGWAGRDYVTGGWRYWIEHRSPLTAGLLCPTRPGRAMPGPGLLAAIADLGRGIPPGAVALQYGCEPASSIVDPQRTTPGPLPSAARPNKSRSRLCSPRPGLPPPIASRATPRLFRDGAGQGGLEISLAARVTGPRLSAYYGQAATHGAQCP